jgi:hypothetical protein
VAGASAGLVRRPIAVSKSKEVYSVSLQIRALLMPSGRKRKRKKIANHKRKKKRRANRHKKK